MNKENFRPQPEVKDNSVFDNTKERVLTSLKKSVGTLQNIDKLPPNESKKHKNRFRGVIKKLAKLASGFIFAGVVGGITLDQVVNRHEIEVVTDSNGDKIYSHSDKETTHLLNYLAGKENLTEEELFNAIKELFKNFFTDFLKKKLPDNYDDLTLSELEQLLMNDPNIKMPPGELSKIIKQQVEKNCDENLGLYNELWELETEAGAPEIRINTSFDGQARPHYLGISHTIYLNPMFVGCELDEFVAEISHAKQFNPQSPFARYTKGTQFGLEMLQIGFRAGLDPSKFESEHRKTYKEDGTIEYEAHKIIEPELLSNYPKIANRIKPHEE